MKLWNWASKFKEAFGDDFYLEIQPNMIPEQWEVNKHIISIGKKLGIKVIATNDVHYTYKEDFLMKCYWLCKLAKSYLMKNDTNLALQIFGLNLLMK